MSRYILRTVSLLILLTSLSCTNNKQESDQVVHLAIWANYVSPEIEQKFTDETGIKIITTNYSSNEELLAKLQSGASQIDVAVPSDYMVAILNQMNVLEPLKKEILPNHKLIEKSLLNQSYDIKNDFSLPYSWTTTGIVINRELFKGTVKGWKDLFENKELVSKIAVLDDSREVIGAALKTKGYSVNSTDPTELKKAEDYLIKIKQNVKMFTSDSIDIMNNKEVIAAQAYSSDALQVARLQPKKIEYILPSEGTTRAIDNLVILKKSKRIENAHKLINFLLSPQADKDRVEKILTGPALAQTQSLLPVDLKNNTSLFPNKKQLSQFEKIQDLGDKNKLYDDIWTRIKSE